MTVILLLLAILCLAIGAGSAASRSIDAGARVFGFVLFAGVAALLAWLALGGA